jgi:hypothetical protein
MSGEQPSIEDARKIIDLVRDHFAKQEPTLAFLHFRVESINKNDDPTIWKVKCSYDKSFGNSERLTFRLKINSKSGIILEQEEIKQDAHKV